MLSRFIKASFFLLLLSVSPIFFAQPVHAVENTEVDTLCNIKVNGVTAYNLKNGESELTLNTGALPIVESGDTTNDSKRFIYDISVCNDKGQSADLIKSGKTIVAAIKLGGPVSGARFADSPALTYNSGTKCLTGKLEIAGAGGASLIDIETQQDRLPICRRAYINFGQRSEDNAEAYKAAVQKMCSSFTASPNKNILVGQVVKFSFDFPSPLKDNKHVSDPTTNTAVRFFFQLKSSSGKLLIDEEVPQTEKASFQTPSGDLIVGSYTASIKKAKATYISGGNYNYSDYKDACGVINLTVGTSEEPGQATGDPSKPGPGPTDAAYALCEQIPKERTSEITACRSCAGYTADGKKEETKGLWTAVGCIPTDYKGITGAVLKTGLSIAGGVALLLILAGAFMLSTSQGEPKRAGEARELLTSAVVGLIFIIFSVTLLQFIGVDILRIPGFGAGRSATFQEPIKGPK